MSNTFSAKELKAQYVSKVGHDLSFCEVEKDGKSYIVMNNNLLPINGKKEGSLVDVPVEEIKALKVIRGATLDDRLDVLAELSVIRGIPTDLVIKTAVALCALFGFEPTSEETDEKIMSMPDRIKEQPNAAAYMLFTMLQDATLVKEKAEQPKPTLH